MLSQGTSLGRSRPRRAVAGPSGSGWRRVRFEQMAESIGDRVDDLSRAGVERYVGLEHLDPESLEVAAVGNAG